jgi:DNA-binding MarR family transcriptional regulator
VAGSARQREIHGRLVLGLLESLEEDGFKSQRRLAAELGIALGLVNAYLNRCIQKGLVKVAEAPARRYSYYLTPKGFIEKSRLSIEYLTCSFGFFRAAKLDCLKLFDLARQRGLFRFVLEGASDLAEIVMICARDTDIQIVAIVDSMANRPRFAGVPIFRAYTEILESVDALVITHFGYTQSDFSMAVAHFGADRVLVPTLLLKSITREAELYGTESLVRRPYAPKR